MSTNLFSRLKTLLPLPEVLVGEVVEIHADNTSTVRLPTGVPTSIYASGAVAVGSLIRPRGTTVPVGKKAFVRAGVIETQAPDGAAAEIEVGRVILPDPPVVYYMGWASPINSSSGSISVSNSGTTQYNPNIGAGTSSAYGGIAGWKTGDVVVYSSAWTAAGAGSTPAFYTQSNGRFLVVFPITAVGGPPNPPLGQMRITATVNGRPTANSYLFFTNSSGFYANQAWGSVA